MMCVVTWWFISQVTTLLLLSTLLYHDEQTPFFYEIENLFDKIISVNGFIKKKITQRYNKTTKTVTIMSYLQLHAVLTHIYIVSQSQSSC